MASAHVGGCVEMSYESHSRNILALGVAGKGGHKVAVVIERNVAQAHFAKLFLEVLRENHLARSGGGHVGEFVALCVELHILEETVNYCHVLFL